MDGRTYAADSYIFLLHLAATGDTGIHILLIQKITHITSCTTHWLIMLWHYICDSFKLKIGCYTIWNYLIRTTMVMTLTACYTCIPLNSSKLALAYLL